MRATLKIDTTLYTVNLSEPLDISIPLSASEDNPIAWYLNRPEISPVRMENWVGKVSEGASVNFNNISFNPHAHGTHTESVGHITTEFYSVNDALKQHLFVAEVLSVVPENVGPDMVISKTQLEALLKNKRPQAIVIRTLPNTREKYSKDYSNTNWPYLQEDAAHFLRSIDVAHLLIDLPSVDKEKDDGKLLAHKAFWNYPEAPRYQATITELIYVPNAIEDGTYLLNLQPAPFVNDAAPCKPVLYALES